MLRSRNFEKWLYVKTKHWILLLLTLLQILLAFSSRSPSFLARPEWKEIPWTAVEKSPRDRLYDIATEITTIYSASYGCAASQLPALHLIFSKLVVWRKGWLNTKLPHLPSSCQGCLGQECSCLELPHPSMFPSNDFTFLIAECTAMLLMVTYMTLEIITRSTIGHSGEFTIHEEYLRIGSVRNRALILRRSLEKTLTLPCFGQAVSDCPGITEGRCRALLPSWVISQEPDGLSTYHSNWWLGLNSRVNYGMER